MSRIVVIDDDANVREMLGLGLAAGGHQVRVANDGREGVKLCAHEMPELVITDLVMPNQEGLETVMTLRRLHPALKIIAMSGGGMNPAGAYLDVAKKMGAVAVLAKPFSLDELKLVVRAALGP